MTTTLQDLHREAAAIAAIRKIADHHAGRKRPAPEALILEIAARRAVEVHTELQHLEKLQTQDLPLPVLTVAGLGGRLEVPWTNYLARILRLQTPDGRMPLARAVVAAAFGVAPGDLHGPENVLAERYLGAPDCCKHGCNLDLVVISGPFAVPIEQKVKASTSDWECEIGGKDRCKGKQLRAYRQLFPAWLRRTQDIEVVQNQPYWYLTPTGRTGPGAEGRQPDGTEPDAAKLQAAELREVGGEGWTPVTHAKLAVWLTEELVRSRRPARRFTVAQTYSAVACIVDLASSIGGTMQEDMAVLEAWRAAPREFPRALALRELLAARRQGGKWLVGDLLEVLQ